MKTKITALQIYEAVYDTARSEFISEKFEDQVKDISDYAEEVYNISLSDKDATEIAMCRQRYLTGCDVTHELTNEYYHNVEKVLGCMEYEKERRTMKAMFIHNNAYDTILLNNGTCFKSVEKKDLEFLLNPNEELDNWDGDESWTDHGDTMLNAAEAYGDVVVMVDDDYKLDVANIEVWRRRLEFYGINIQELFDDFLESVKGWKADHAPEMDDLEVDDPTFDKDTGKIVCYARDDKESYVLVDDGTGNIVINYLGTR